MSSIAITGGATGTGVFSLLAPSTSTNRTLTLPDETGTLQTSGGAISGTTGTFSGIVAANGGGIQFPATQVPSANANTLDDYEEGTWTPTIAFSGTSSSGAVYTNQIGYYTRIGNIVQAQCLCAWNNKGSGTGNFSLNGLPFSSSFYNSACFSITGINYSGSPFAQSSPSEIQCYFYYQNETGTKASITNTAIGSSGEVILTVVYRATS